jgi:nitroreductase
MIFDLVYRNRSYRRFHEEKRLTRAQLIELIKVARYIPSAGNLQKLRYFLIYEEDKCDLIFPHLKWASYLKNWNGPEKGERPSAYIIILAPVNSPKMVYIDTGIAAQTILLSAVDNGFGGCMLASVDKQEVQNTFSLPEEMEIMLVIALGYPAELVVIEDVTEQGKIEYWRDEKGIHYVPKRKIRDLIINY